jgi:MFS family permease
VKRTGATALVAVALLGAAAGFVLDNALTAFGRPTFVPAVTLPILLLLLGGIVLALAIPVYRATRGHTTTPVNPFRALRVAVLAKASSLVGAAIGGLATGLLTFALTRDVTPSLGSLGTVIATAVCGAILVAAGLVAEQLCTLRKDDDDDQPGGPPTGVDGTLR